MVGCLPRIFSISNFLTMWSVLTFALLFIDNISLVHFSNMPWAQSQYDYFPLKSTENDIFSKSFVFWRLYFDFGVDIFCTWTLMYVFWDVIFANTDFYPLKKKRLSFPDRITFESTFFVIQKEWRTRRSSRTRKKGR